VVGAGPGGSAAAYHLARHGVDVLMVDKATFPREKVCGDGLTPRAVKGLQDMGVDVDDPGFARADGLRTYAPGGRILDLPWPTLRSFPARGLVRTRFDLDQMLSQLAVKAGARFEQGVEAGAPVVEEGWVKGVTVKDADGREEVIRARHVVAADGAPARLGSHLGIVRDPRRAIGIAARRYYRSPRPFEPVLESFLNLRGGDGLMPGYGWIFFLPDSVLNVGAGLLSTFRGFQGTSAKRVFEVFVQGLPPEWGITEENALGPLMSGPLPTAMNRRPAAVPGMLLVGDAAGMVNPFNGEGISCAIESGRLAADLVAGALARNRPALTQMYPVLLRKRYGRYYFAGNAWARIIGNPRFLRFAVAHGVPRRRFMEFAMRVMANLTDGKDGDVDDRIMHAIMSLMPER
jgi:geranylgeranyl reductase family protein